MPDVIKGLLDAKPEPPVLSETNLHSHECPACGTVWRHDPDTIAFGHRIKAHTCPKPGCGTGQFEWRCEGDQGLPSAEVPAGFCHNGTRIITIEAQS